MAAAARERKEGVVGKRQEEGKKEARGGKMEAKEEGKKEARGRQERGKRRRQKGEVEERRRR